MWTWFITGGRTEAFWQALSGSRIAIGLKYVGDLATPDAQFELRRLDR